MDTEETESSDRRREGSWPAGAAALAPAPEAGPWAPPPPPAALHVPPSGEVSVRAGEDSPGDRGSSVGRSTWWEAPAAAKAPAPAVPGAPEPGRESAGCDADCPRREKPARRMGLKGPEREPLPGATMSVGSASCKDDLVAWLPAGLLQLALAAAAPLLGRRSARPPAAAACALNLRTSEGTSPIRASFSELSDVSLRRAAIKTRSITQGSRVRRRERADGVPQTATSASSRRLQLAICRGSERKSRGWRGRRDCRCRCRRSRR